MKAEKGIKKKVRGLGIDLRDVKEGRVLRVFGMFGNQMIK